MATNNAVNNVLSGSTGTGNFVGSTSPSITTANLIGTSTNNNAAAGSVGELISSVIASASPVSLTDSTPANVTSISLTAGDWDVFGNVSFAVGGTCTGLFGWSSDTSATAPNASLYNGISLGVGAIGSSGLSIPTLRYSLSGTTTIYLSVNALFSTSTVGAFGGIYARRRR